MEAEEQKIDTYVSIKPLPKGPLMVKGNFKLTKADGTSVDHKGTTALCRCGHSKNKPYCDGSHQKVDFDK